MTDKLPQYRMRQELYTGLLPHTLKVANSKQTQVGGRNKSRLPTAGNQRSTPL